jgi:hypothetical protein
MKPEQEIFARELTLVALVLAGIAGTLTGFAFLAFLMA